MNQHSAKLIRSIFAAAPIGIGLTVHRVMLNANDYLLKMLGYSRSELIGQNARMLYADQVEFDRVGEVKYRQISEKGIGVVETVWKRKDGRMVNIILSSAPLDPNDLSKGITFTAQDITDRKQTELELLEREAQIRAFIETAEDMVYFRDSGNRVSMLNAACLKMTGFHVEEFDADPGLWRSLVHPDDVIDMDSMKIAGTAGASFETNYRLRSKSGEWRWIHSRMSVAKDMAGNEIGLNCIDRDISDRKLFEEQILFRAEQLKRHHASLLTLARCSHDDFVTALSSILKACAATIGVARVSYWRYAADRTRITSECLYIHALDAYESGAELHARDFPAYFRAIELERVIAAHDTASDPRTADFLGSYCAPLGITSMLDVPVYKQGRIAGILCLEHIGPARIWTPEEQDYASSISDIISVNLETMDRRNAERSFIESEKRSRLFLNSTPDFVFLKDSAFRYIFTNDALRKFFNRPEAEILNHTDRDLQPSYIAESCLQTDLRALDSETVVISEELHEERSFESIKFAIDLEDGTKGIGGYIRDITDRKRIENERKRLETQMQHTQKLESLGVLAGGIAHDFNNLLLTILGNADLALCDIPPSHSARTSIEGIIRGAQRAAELCRQMLAYSGKGRFVVQSLNLNDVVLEMTHLIEASISKKARIYFNLSGTIPAIEADATQMRQVIMNLITNASEALEDRPGTIHITTGLMHCDMAYLQETYLKQELPESDYVFIEVSDTGIGMDPVMIDRIFEPFFSTKFTGRGLGLAAVLGIVRGHSGAIKVYSEPGRGTCIKILFPVSAYDAKAVPAQSLTDSDEPTRFSGTILLTDDDPAILSVARRMLDKLGFSVLTAHDGIEALDRFERYQNVIDCVILDLTMPNLDGIETFRKMKQVKPGIRIVMSSGYNEQEVTQRFTGRGLAGFIQKPYRFDELHAVLKSVFSDSSR